MLLKKIKLHAIVSCLSLSRKRLDYVLSQLFKDYSRSYLKQLILLNQVFVNKNIVNQPDKKILGGEVITIEIAPKNIESNIPENINLNVIYEDKEIIVINKPAGIVVHPGAGNNRGTIFNALLYHYKNAQYLPRAGIIHRLDKDTTGLMVIAKTIFSYSYLLKLFQKRTVVKEYEAIVKGNMISGGIINIPIMRHHKKRTRMMVHYLGKESITHYKIINRLKCHTHISVKLETGRTHQIRVHMLYIGYPIVGDAIYGNLHRSKYDKKNNNVYQVREFSRQALHASRIALHHPINQNLMSWTIPLPQDMKNLLLSL